LKNKAFILLIILFSGVIIGFFLFRHQYDIARIPTIGSAAPDIELIDFNNNKLRLSDMKGSVVFVNFWATWCKSCVDEMPSIEGLFRTMSNNPKFKLITILYKDNEYRAFSYMKGKGYTFPVYINPDGSAAKKFGITGIPETFIIDKKGVLMDKVTGPAEWDSLNAVETFHKLINE
jgi:cytochrome c biogenesis protein CcmG/thiol:disulfide interchange protein DsbE